MKKVSKWDETGSAPAWAILALRCNAGDLGAIDRSWQGWQLTNGKLFAPDDRRGYLPAHIHEIHLQQQISAALRAELRKTGATESSWWTDPQAAAARAAPVAPAAAASAVASQDQDRFGGASMRLAGPSMALPFGRDKRQSAARLTGEYAGPLGPEVPSVATVKPPGQSPPLTVAKDSARIHSRVEGKRSGAVNSVERNAFSNLVSGRDVELCAKVTKESRKPAGLVTGNKSSILQSLNIASREVELQGIVHGIHFGMSQEHVPEPTRHKSMDLGILKDAAKRAADLVDVHATSPLGCRLGVSKLRHFCSITSRQPPKTRGSPPSPRGHGRAGPTPRKAPSSQAAGGVQLTGVSVRDREGLQCNTVYTLCEIKN